MEGQDRPRGGYNLAASSVKINKSKTKQKGFHLLSFIFQNRDFSEGYGGFKQKNPASVSGCVQNVSNARSSSVLSGNRPSKRFDSEIENGIALISDFGKRLLSTKFSGCRRGRKTLTRAFPVAAGEERTTTLTGVPLEGARIRFGLTGQVLDPRALSDPFSRFRINLSPAL